MTRILLLQLATSIIVALIATWLGGESAGISSILAGLSCVLPNALFAYGLYVGDRRAPKSGPAPLYIWEFVKIILTITLMVAVFWLYQDVNWLAFLVSFVVVLKSYIILLLKSRN